MNTWEIFEVFQMMKIEAHEDILRYLMMLRQVDNKPARSRLSLSFLW